MHIGISLVAASAVSLGGLLGIAQAPVTPAGAEGRTGSEVWTVDAAHTEVAFSVRHFFTPVTGKFGQFEVQLDYDAANPSNSRVSARIPVASVDTGNEQRDEHLRTADFFNAATHQYITFESTSVRSAGENQLVATGNLTIKDVTREIEFPIEVLGVMDVAPEMQEMLGATRLASFQGALTIDRRTFGVGTGSWAETAVVGSDVEITIRVEAKQ